VIWVVFGGRLIERRASDLFQHLVGHK
jgi:hypothetical protein